MKRIGIITFSRANNYGAVLQAYALKTKLTLLGADAKVLNYICPAIDSPYALSPFKRSRKLSQLPFNILRIPLVWRTRHKFQPFRRKFLQDTPELDDSNIRSANACFDAFVTGSDQVFNLKLTGNDENYFLNFVSDNHKKFSFAASFGVSKQTEEESSLAKPLLCNFQEISCREESGCHLVQQLTGRQALLHLDPTLLLSPADWGQIAHKPARKNYILAYLIVPTPTVLSFIKRLATQTKLPVIVLTSSPIKRLKAAYICPSPEEWVGYFMNAKYVVTNSFHGLAFAINYNKDFFVDLLPPSHGTNSRMESLLNITNLQHRLTHQTSGQLQTPVEWQAVNKVLNEYKKQAETYLTRMIGE